jgi:hypothetical protein
MRYIANFLVNCTEGRVPVEEIRAILQKYGFEGELRGSSSSPGYWSINMTIEKSDPRYEAARAAAQELKRFPLGTAGIIYRPVFEPREVTEAELLILYIRAEAGEGFKAMAERLGLAPGTAVMNKRAMGQKEIGVTYGFEIVISGRVRAILIEEALTGWDARLVQHKSENNRFPPLYHLVPTNTLPPMGPSMEFQEFHYTNPKDNLYGTVAIKPASPITYLREDLVDAKDFNLTREQFGDAPVKTPSVIITQRAWQTFKKHKIRNLDAEPVVILS